MLTRCASYQFYEIGDEMSPGKNTQKRSPGKRPERLFDLFVDNPPSPTTNDTAYNAAAAPPVGAFPPTGGAAEPATQTETVCNSPASIEDAESPVIGDDIDALLGEKSLAASDDEATISTFGLDDEEIVSTLAIEQAMVAKFESLYAMRFDGKEVLLTLAAVHGDENVAVEYLLNGVRGRGSEKVNHGDPSGMPAQEDVHDHSGGDGDNHELSQEGRERLVVLRTRSKGFSEEEIANILHVFRQNRMAALDLELEGPSSIRTAAPPTHLCTNLTLPPQASVPPTTFGPSNSDYISPFTNGYIATSPPVDPHPTKISPTTESLKRPLDTSADTTARHKKQKKGARAPTPPRYRGLTREEYMRCRFGEGR